MFHLKCVRKRSFLTWDELGCLARCLGFQIDLFSTNLTDEIAQEDQGLQLQEVYRMLDYKLLHKALHFTCNIHNDNWNVAVIRKSISLVEQKIFTFEQLHCIRVAYQLYEEQDSKGVYVQQRVLLRALKMCGRTIAPLKLMHRIKHMKGAFVEPGRIQLDEFLDLILWCDQYEEFEASKMEYSQGADDGLFKLVDLNRLLSHHDARLLTRLNAKYLAEEWDFGCENLGSKRASKEPPVNNQYRVQQVERHKNDYLPLKSEVNKSENRLHRSRVGFVRPRPVTAPNLSTYHYIDRQADTENQDVTPLSVADIIKKVFQKETKNVKVNTIPTFEPTRHLRKTTRPYVTPEDIEDVENKMADVLFNMETLECRYQHEMEKDREFLMPTYRPRPKTAKELNTKTSSVKTKRPVQMSREARINNLVHPKPRNKLCHSKSCDARYRGWYAVNSGSDNHYIIASKTHQNSPQAQLHKELHVKCLNEIRHLHGEFLHRQKSTKHPVGGRRSRPLTAPSVIDGRTISSRDSDDSVDQLPDRGVSNHWDGGINDNESVEENNLSLTDQQQKVSDIQTEGNTISAAENHFGERIISSKNYSEQEQQIGNEDMHSQSRGSNNTEASNVVTTQSKKQFQSRLQKDNGSVKDDENGGLQNQLSKEEEKLFQFLWKETYISIAFFGGWHYGMVRNKSPPSVQVSSNHTQRHTQHITSCLKGHELPKC